ncbi:trypsin-like peptidase domain-containing protein [Streptomyces humi]|uniref:nSTAND1 domain-containing NTPase n=1 Tax=Streptomyces humi TaxID=1428620 RepID=UPI00069C1E7C|nr:trypsin-like peptidase domain-containing protein [Streptomyces humi]
MEAGEADGTSFPDAAVLRIFASPPDLNVADGPLGVGFLVDDRHAITCAHVVVAAVDSVREGESRETARVHVDLPLLSGPGSPAATVTARVVLWGPSLAAGGLDVAVLRLDSAVAGAGPARIVDIEPEAMRGHVAQIVGFPEGRGQGVWHEGVVRGRQADGQVQVDRVGTGYRVSRGFSGSPVWDQALGAVIGMMVKAELGEPAAGFMIPVSQLVATWPPLGAVARPRSPFRSLEPFEEAHAAAFFGRDADTARLAQVVSEQRWTTLVGPSGCGKSSLAMAGVAPRRRDEGDTVAILRPAHHATAFRGLAAVLLDLLEPHCAEAERFSRISAVADEIARHGIRGVAARILHVQDARRLLIVIDQFEELLDDEVFARGDIDALADALGPKSPPTVSVLAVLRTDFLGPVLAHPRLGLLAKKRIEALEPMRQGQLRDIVTKPVDDIPAVGYEDALVNRILGDAGDAPGILPLLSFTLAQLWDHQRGGRLTHHAYDALGGVTGALGTHADQIWKQYVGDEDEEHAEKLLTRLVRTPIGTEAPVRRLTTRTELSDREWQIAQRLAGARLLVLNRARVHDRPGPEGGGRSDVETVELAHEALISSWDRLSARVKADRAFLDWRENLQLDTERWDQAGRPRDLLPSATALAAAQWWLPERTAELGNTQRDFLDQGRAHRRLLARRRRAVMALFGVLLIVAGVTAVVAVNQRQTVVRQRDRATSAEIAGLAQSLGRTDPQLARRLAVAATSLGDTPEAWSALLSVRYQPEKRTVQLPSFDVTAVDLDRTGHILVAGGGTDLGTWNVDTGKQIGSYQTTARVRNVGLSADGTTVAVSTDDDTTTVLDSRGLHPRGHAYPTGPALFSLSSQGTYLVATIEATNSGYIAAVWNTHTGKLVLQRSSDSSLHPSFSQDERVLWLTGVSGKGPTRTDLRTGKDLPTLKFGLKPDDSSGSVTFSSDSQQLALLTTRGLYTAAAPYDHRVYSNTIQVPRSLTYAGLGGGDVQFSHDGKFIAFGFTLWDALLPEDPVFTYPTIYSDCESGTFRFSADDSELRCVGSDGTVRSLDISRLTLHGKQTDPNPTAVASQNGATIAVAQTDGGDGGGKVQVWSTKPLTKRMELTVPVEDRLLLSPDGRLMAAQVKQDKVEIWDLAKHVRLGTLPGNVGGATRTVAISPDDKSYVTYDRVNDLGPGGVVNSLRFYDLTTMKLIRQENFTIKAAMFDFSTTVTFQPDGRAVVVSPLLGTVAFPSGKILVHGTPDLNLDGFSPTGESAYSDPSSVQGNLIFLDPKTLGPTGEALNVGGLSAGAVPTAHSADGRLIAAVYDDTASNNTLSRANEIKIWDLQSRRQLGSTLTGPTGDLELTTFTADNSTLVSLDDQGMFRTYTVAPSQLVHELCTMSGGLTKHEWQTHIPDIPYQKTC